MAARLPIACCEIFENINFTDVGIHFSNFLKQMSGPQLGGVATDIPIYWSNPKLWLAAACIIFNPLFWNVIARWEHRTQALTHVFGTAERGCYALAFVICLLGLFRDYWFQEAISSQPVAVALCTDSVQIVGTVMIITGTVLVLSSTWSLGITGTFLGDYFGLLMNKRATNFPFNIMNNPMYWGSSMNFLGYSLRQCSPTGLLLTALVTTCYKIAILYEGPFTEQIYAEKKFKEEKEE